jgi:uncharacterized protein (TIGR02284 family)
MSRNMSNDFGNEGYDSLDNPDFRQPMSPAMEDEVQADANYKGTADVDEAIRQLNSFLRGEISAAETYRMALEKINQPTDTNTADVSGNTGLLREIQQEHGRAVQALRDRIKELGGQPSDSSGAWGAWAKMSTNVSSLFGDSGSLKILKEGEEHGLKDYEAGLDDVDMTSAELVQNQLIPAQQRHINLIDQLLNSPGTA